MAELLNSPVLYLITAVIIIFVVGFCIISLIRAYKAGRAIGMDEKKLKRTIISSITFSILPSVSILLGVIALSGSLGIPLPWLRLSVVGALHYETSVADIAARATGLENGLAIEGMTATAFTTIGVVMTIGIIWGCIAMFFFGKKYSKKLQVKPQQPGKKSFADKAMVAMFIGLITAYVGTYIAQFVQRKDGAFICTGEYLQLVTLLFSGIAMAVFLYFAEKKNKKWLDNFSIAGSMLIGMAAAVIVNQLF